MITHDLAALWRTWANDYLTLDKFAEDHGLKREDAFVLLNVGRKYQNILARENKAIAYAQSLTD